MKYVMRGMQLFVNILGVLVLVMILSIMIMMWDVFDLGYYVIFTLMGVGMATSRIEEE